MGREWAGERQERKGNGQEEMAKGEKVRGQGRDGGRDRKQV